MKKIIAVLLIAVLALSVAACGGKTPVPVETTTEAQTTVEETTDPAVTEPEVGRIGEKSTFYVYIPDNWCKMEYTGDSTRLRLFDIPSAPKIEKNKTPEVEIKVAAEVGKKDDVDAAVAELLKIEGAKKGKDVKLDGEDFAVVTYTDPQENREFIGYIGLGGGSLATVTLKGIKPDDEDAAAILRSISFKPMGKRSEPTTTTKPATTATTKAADEKTTAAAKTTTAAVKDAAKTTKAVTEATAVAKANKVANDNKNDSKTNSVSPKCLKCEKKGTHEMINPFSNETEYYCDYHYSELNKNMDKILGDN